MNCDFRHNGITIIDFTFTVSLKNNLLTLGISNKYKYVR